MKSPDKLTSITRNSTRSVMLHRSDKTLSTSLWKITSRWASYACALCLCLNERKLTPTTTPLFRSAQLGLDFILIVGGFDSSNTQHLLEIPLKAGVKSYHINRAECIKADNTITHRKLNGEIVTEHFLPPKEGGKVCLGVTSGASTPDASVQDCLDQIFLLKNVMSSWVNENNKCWISFRFEL